MRCEGASAEVYLLQQVLHLPLPGLAGGHHLQVLLLGELSEGGLPVRLVLIAQLLTQGLQLSSERGRERERERETGREKKREGERDGEREEEREGERER